MIDVIMFSGGLSSALSALYLKEKSKNIIHWIFCNTLPKNEELF
jgi:tRNA U34 2-thiouridine synthase MnmA/TrmU